MISFTDLYLTAYMSF